MPDISPPGRATTTLTSGQALQRLLAGNHRYSSPNYVRPAETAERRLAVAAGQQPFACILGCSDSRVPLELVFDQGLGDLFVIRVAGNVANDDAVLGSIEFAVQELGIPLVLVLGHERCGAVQATLAAVLQGTPVAGHIGSLVADITPAVLQSRHQRGDHLDNAVRANVALVVGQLKAAAPILAPRVQADQLQIVGARYDLESGRVAIIA
ncbi:MAG TPA: carbonic anhydrase [Chloroflexia bacterium]|nr:carbonic anhydrase [Chloroflexia bacterium]